MNTTPSDITSQRTEVHELAFHETYEQPMCFGMRYRITCVATGWIYIPIIRDHGGKDTYLQPVFVPFK